MATKRKQKSLPVKVITFFSSYGLAVVLILLLLALTYFGTMAQVEIGLYEASNKYFESLFVFEKIGQVPIILPGVYLVSGFLFLNILTGAIIRARKSWRRPGMLIAHAGILYILLAGFVAFHHTKEGRMTLFEGDSTDEISNLTEWCIEVSKRDADGGAEKIYVIEPEEVSPLAKPRARRTFFSDGIPFEFELSGYVRNIANKKGQLIGLVEESAEQKPGDVGKFIDGLALAPIPTNKQAEQNLPGGYIEVRGKDGETLADSFIIGSGPFSSRPLTVEIGGERWSIDLTRRRYTLPFAIELIKFQKEDHPGTRRAREYSSDVVRIDGEARADKVHISMNKPMRHGGFTVYQADWGQQGDRLYTGLAVSHNPADQWPKYGTYVIAFGMTVHFVQKLLAYLRRSARTRKSKEANA